MVLQRREGTEMYRRKAMDVYELRETEDGRLVREFGLDFFNALVDSSPYHAATAALLPALPTLPAGGVPITDIVADGRDGTLLLRVLTPHPPCAPVPEVIDLWIDL